MDKRLSVSRTLAAIATGTHKVLRLYYHKEKWPTIYPTLVKLAQLYIDCYEAAPGAMHAQLGLYSKDLGYSSNLVINQNVLVCMACHGLKYSREVTEELLLASFADYLCVAKESDKRAAGKKLNPQQEKLWLRRHQFAVKILADANTPNLQCLRVLSRLTSYDARLVSSSHHRFNDHASLVVAVAHRLAMFITPNAKTKQLAFDKAIKLLYCNQHYSFALKILSAIAQRFAQHPAALLCQLNQQTGLLVHVSGKEKLLVIIENDEARKLAKANRRFDFHCGCTTVSGPQLSFKVWQRALLETKQPFGIDQSHLLQAVAALSQSHFQSFRALENLISQFDSVSRAIQVAARQYNRENLKASSVRHSLAMVGLDAAGLLSQRVLLEQVMTAQQLPFSEDVLHKYGQLTQLIALYVGDNYGEEFERLLSPFAAVVAFIVLKQGVEVQHTMAKQLKDFSDEVISIAHLFGIQQLNKDELTDFIEQYFHGSILHKALLDSELKARSQANSQTKPFIFIKLQLMQILSPDWQPSSWQKQLMTEVIADSRFDDGKSFANAIQEAGFYSHIG